MKKTVKGKTVPLSAAPLPALEKARLCAQVAAAHKAENPLILKVTEIASFTDYFLICSARSTRHVQAVAEHIEKELRQRRLKPIGIEGLAEGHWVLLDLGDVIVHIFYRPVRAFYDLEGLWAEARQVDITATWDNPLEPPDHTQPDSDL